VLDARAYLLTLFGALASVAARLDSGKEAGGAAWSWRRAN
jgi:hypothetical protein